MTVSSIPALFGLQMVFLLAAGTKAKAQPAIFAALFVGLILSAWGALSAVLALNGVYESKAFLALYPGLWLPAVPFVLIAVSLLFPSVRAGLTLMADTVPAHWFVAVQVLRIAALGTLVKTVQGDFPLEVELAIGLTDLAFGLSAIWMFFKVRGERISEDALILWHAVGVLLIVIPGEVAMQSGLPGPAQVFTQHPTSEVMLDWPMVLAPSLVVPTFLLLNILAAVAAHRNRLGTHLRKDQIE